jgi:hypothetical protein
MAALQVVLIGALPAGSARAEEAADDAAPRKQPSRSERAATPTLPGSLAPRDLPPAAQTPLPASAPAARPATPPTPDSKKPRNAGAPVEIRTPKDDFKAQLGSQAARGGGVVGKYDGVTASKALGDAARLNLLGGFPLAPSSEARFDPNRSFYALSLDLIPFDQGVVGRIFGVQQRIDAKQERNAIGGELGFDHARGFGLVSVDYDVGFRDVGALSLLASTKLDARTTLNAYFDARRYANAPSPYAALQGGQAIGSVAQLLDRLAQAELRAPSFDSAAQTRTVGLGAARQLTSQLRLAADLTLRDVIPDPATPRTPAPAAAGQLDYSLKATWKDFLIARSSTSAGLRIAELADSRRYAGSLGGQYPLLQNLRVGPDLAFEFAEAKEQWTYKPSMRFEYLQSKLRLDFQLGLELRDLDGAPLDRTGVFYRVGYKYDF